LEMCALTLFCFVELVLLLRD